MKKFLSLLLMLLIVIALTFGLAYSLSTPEEQSGSSMSAGSELPAGSSPSADESSPSGSPSGGSNPTTSGSDVSADESQAPVKQVYSFLAAGDNIMHTSVLFGAIENAAAINGTSPDYSKMKEAEYNFDLIYRNIEKLVADADLSYINQETLIGGGSIRSYPTFCSPDAIGYKVHDLGFDVVNMTHNHMLDAYGSAYLKNCDSFFRNLNLTPLGYYKDSDATANIPVVTVGDVKIAFLAYTESLNGLRLQSGDSTVIPLLSDTELIRKQVALAKEAADLVFVSVHWGTEDSSTPTGQVFSTNYNSNQKYVSLFLELNVDAVIGMHSHVIETCEWRTRNDGKKTFIAYSLGNLVSGMYYGRNMLGAILTMDIVRDADEVYIENPKLLPTVMHYTKGTRVSSSKSDISGGDTGFRNNEIILLENYSEELAAAHGCHAKDDASFSSSRRFTYANLIKRTLGTIPEEFLPDYIIALGSD